MKSSFNSIIVSAGVLAALFLGCQGSFQFPKGSSVLTSIPEAYYTGTFSCVICHDDVFLQYKNTIHYRIESFELNILERGCETCHGPGSLHIKKKGDVASIIGFSRLSSQEASAICLQCHTGSPTMNWPAGFHVSIGCNECHKSHRVTSPKMVYLGDPEICFNCHQGKKGQHMLPSHHPILERKMKCSSCHNIHGSENNNLNRETINDVCFECHAEYQGPFVYEHEPVFEDCSLCHNPHGTIADNLLKQSEPFICLRCHKGHRKNPGTGAHPTVASFLTSCTQCHSQVHGSDLPSQLSGPGLTR